MAENLKRLLTDASVISVIVMYSYIVYLAGEIGYLSAFGITGSASLIPLEVQNVIFGFLQGLMYFAIFIGIVLPVMLLVINKVGTKVSIGNSKRLQGVCFLFSVGVASLEVPSLKDSYGFSVALAMFMGAVVITFLAIFVKVPRASLSLVGLVEKLLNKLTREDSTMNQEDTRRLFIIASAMAALFVPMLSFTINYNKVSVEEGHEQIVKVVTLDGEQYLLVRQYSDKNVLVQLNGEKLLPNYIVLQGSQLEKTSYSIERKTIDRSLLFPKPASAVRLSEYMHSFLLPYR